jgi:hypothetical protein
LRIIPDYRVWHDALDIVVPSQAWVLPGLCSILPSTHKKQRTKILHTKAPLYDPNDCTSHARSYSLYDRTIAAVPPRYMVPLRLCRAYNDGALPVSLTWLAEAKTPVFVLCIIPVSVPYGARCVRPTHPIPKPLLTHRVSFRRAEAIYDYCVVHTSLAMCLRVRGRDGSDEGLTAGLRNCRAAQWSSL